MKVQDIIIERGAVGKIIRDLGRRGDYDAAMAKRAARQEKSLKDKLFGKKNAPSKFANKNRTVPRGSINDLRRRAAGARAAAWERMKQFGNAFMGVLTTLGVAWYVREYWAEITILEQDYQEFVDSIEKGTELKPGNQFAGMEESAALEHAEQLRQTILGEKISKILLISGFLGKFVSGFGKLSSIIFPTASKPIIWLGQFIKFAEGGPARRLAVIGFLEGTPEGKELMNGAIAYMIFRAVGWTADMFLKAVEGAVDAAEAWIENKTGLDVPGIPDEARSKIKPAPGAADREAQAAANSLEVGGVRVTDKDGYLTTDRVALTMPLLRSAVRHARQYNKPNPLDGIPLKPGATYPQDVLKDLGISN